MAEKIGKGAPTVVRDLGSGQKISITQTLAGVRANLHEAGSTRPVDPLAYGVRSVSASSAGGDATRVTTRNTDGTATDFTKRPDGSVSKVVHDGPTSRPKR